MPIDGKYGVITAEKKIFHEGEPVFLIRATDPLAVVAVIRYSEQCAMAGCDNEHVKACITHAERIKDWQLENPSLVKKLPD